MVELEGEKLTRCVQCGYKFTISTNSNSSGIIKTLETTPEIATLISKLKHLKTQKKSHETGTIHQSRISTKNKTKTKTKKTQLKESKKPIWFVIIKWYVIISIFTGVLSSFFR